jgi:hypothetical protein
MTETCSICGKPQGAEHDQLNHEFNINGQLIPKAKPAHSKPPSAYRPTVIGAWDIELRQALINKGIITHEDLPSLRNPDPSPAGDREAGEGESTG